MSSVLLPSFLLIMATAILFIFAQYSTVLFFDSIPMRPMWTAWRLRSKKEFNYSLSMFTSVSSQGIYELDGWMEGGKGCVRKNRIQKEPITENRTERNGQCAWTWIGHRKRVFIDSIAFSTSNTTTRTSWIEFPYSPLCLFVVLCPTAYLSV